MDMSLVAAALAQQASATQQQVATTVLKQNLNAQKDAVQIGRASCRERV